MAQNQGKLATASFPSSISTSFQYKHMLMLKGKLAVASFPIQKLWHGDLWLLAYTLILCHVLYFEISTWHKIKES